ncbi:uncharacterized protein EKO05_0002608 [Ascochyta rabiei]|uniref:Uncharacterized protein n=1 Tax=Didymella rabiei TaxID=5454 RepID=A0A163IH34_DIDRA|nr:uncharacterized protein EKO05_0002608 [Ascochyta rabiei]KZM25759.1 hypothetical protein ST47_g3032 [Ascochyta rabiei]UPX12031.1 hypothetical protein EKO05_0002608 [Ascochyta rabiei]
MVTLIDLLSTTYAPVQAMMLPYLGIAEVVALTRTCKGFGQLLPVLKATAWNIDYQLKKFFGKPKEFRSVLGRCEGLIAGAFARRFFSRFDITCDSIDMHVNHRDELVRYLKDDGYQSIDQSLNSFSKTGAKGEDLLVTFEWSVHSVVGRAFHNAKTTADLNFISWNKAYALSPYSTFVERESFLLTCLVDETGDHLKMLSDEGLKTKTVSWDQRRFQHRRLHDIHMGFDITTRRRRIGDRFSWVLGLDVEGVRSPCTPDAVIETTTFRSYAPWKYTQPWQVANYELDFDENIRHPILKHQYITLGEDTLDEDGSVQFDEFGDRERTSHYARRCEELKDRLDELTLLELTKIPTAGRPPQFATLSASTSELKEAHTTRGGFKLPATWTFYDDEVIAFLEMAWSEQQLIDEHEKHKLRTRFLDNTSGSDQALRDFCGR